MIKEAITSILIAIGLITSPINESENIEIKEPTSTLSVESSIEENGVIEKHWKNDFGHKAITTENEEKQYYTLQYELNGYTYSYHTHSLYDFEDMLRVHQKNIDANFDGFEWINPTNNKYYQSEMTIVDVRRTRRYCIKVLKRIENGETSKDVDEVNKLIERLKKYGYDWENQIDYMEIYGDDWKCYIDE